jgi:hypothetical protein
VVDLAACERLGRRAIVRPDDGVGLTKTDHLSDDAIDRAIRVLADRTVQRLPYLRLSV